METETRSWVEKLERAQANQRRQRLVRQVAIILVNRMRISTGRELVGLIGRGNERNNGEALITWIEGRLAEESVDGDAARWAARLAPELRHAVESTSE